VEKILEVQNLKTHFFLDEGTVKAVDGVDFDLFKGKTLGIVGESGCGKSVTAQSIMRIVPSPPGRIVEGKILFHRNGTETNITKLNAHGREMRAIRGKEISMIFQEPMTSLSPVHTVGLQIIEVIRLHQGLAKKEAKELAVEMLRDVGIPRPEKVVDNYPHQLSGGMRQRAMIARAISCRPSILIADEPTTALDVTVQDQILKLLKDRQEEMGMALILITHDLGVIAQTVDFVSVFYLGIVVEEGDVFQVFDNPVHPYTQALFDSIPRLDKEGRLYPISGSVPDPFAVIRGCPFRERCSKSIPRCETEEFPDIYEVEKGHRARCFLYASGESADE
jgi:oligopeptide/dipeptide ABC transporter ATP-binding protein